MLFPSVGSYMLNKKGSYLRQAEACIPLQLYLLNLTSKNAIVEYLDYQIPVTQLKGPKGNREMQAAKRD